MSSDLLIKINADAKNATKAYDDLKKQTEDLEGTLNKVALIGAAAFAAFSAEIYVSVKAFNEAEASSVQLSNALQNQGIFTKELKDEYKSFAQAVQEKTGIDDDAITKAQALAQGYLGQTKITKDLSFAIADLAALEGGGLNSAAEKIARTIGTGTNAFARQGLVIDDTATTAERYAKVLEFVRAKAGGLSEEFNKADGYSKAVQTAFGNLQEEIGSRFAPAIAAVNKALVSFFKFISDNPILVDLAASIILAGAAVGALAAGVALAVPVFTALTAAVTYFGIASNVAFAGIPAAIGLIVAGLTFLALNWTTSVNYIKSITSGFATFVYEAFEGIAKVFQGLFTLDTGKLSEGIEQIKQSFAKARDVGQGVYKELTAAQTAEIEVQKAANKKAGDEEEARRRVHQQNLIAIRKAEIELLRMQNENASAAAIDLQTKEIEVLKALDQQKSAEEIQLLRDKKAIIQGLQDEQNAEDLERKLAFNQIIAETDAELSDKKIQIDTELREAQLTALRAQAQSEADIERQMQADILATKTAARNKELLDRKQFGETVAVINKALGSKEVTAAKDAADSLVALSNSKNDTLKSIGKAAAVTQIGIDTAKGAMSVYANFQSAIPYPPVSIPLGIAAAAAITAYGAERVGNVLAAADGGLVQGGVPGRDSVPALLMPGELVVPKRNFNDVVGAVQGDNKGTGNADVVALLERIDSKFSNPQTTVIHGDVHTDASYIDSLVKKISDAVEFRNAKIFGVVS